MFAMAASGFASILLDDTFADGARTIQNLPTESAWFASSGASLTTAPGAMTLAMGGSAILGVTYFAPNADSPIVLNVGDTLSATITFTFNGVAPLNTSQGFRIGLFDFGTNRASADFSSSSSQGGNVQGYSLFQTMGVTFNNSTPTDIRKRTTVTDKSLLGTSGDWTSLGTGPGDTNTFSGFAEGAQYVLQLSLQRTDASSLLISAMWLNPANGAVLSTSVTDTSATNFNFDGIALRPQTAATSSTNIVFNEVRVELIPAASAPSIDAQPQDESVFTGQNATFTVIVSGSAPLTYQWFYNSDTPLTNATNSSLTITNAQLSDSGGYSIVVSNAYDSVVSDTAELTVSVPTAPIIVTQPQSQTVLPGQSASFSVSAGGSAPFTYQWYFNTNTPIAGATGDTLTLTNVQIADTGTYSVVVSNFVNFTNSLYAVLSVNTNPVAPSFISQPASQVVLTGDTATFSATIIGTEPISYQWNKNGEPVSDATSSTLTLTNVQSSDAGSYTFTASNSVGGAISSAAILTVTPTIPVVNSAYNLVGFGQNTTGGGLVSETSTNYFKVYNAVDLAVALNDKKGIVKVIEIMNDLDLGYNEIPADAKTNSEPFRADNAPLLHPVLLQTGVSLIDIQKKNGLTIFSANGATIRHAHLNLKNSSNVIIRNLKFDQLWEWDEATKGQYDKQNWDFITVGDAGAVTNLWIDHCTFTKAYDGIVDIKNGSSGITISWCKYVGDDGYTNRNSWVYQQLDALEANKSAYPMYNFLRSNGFSEDDIFAVIQGHDKTHLIGANDLDPNNALHTVTLHHEWFINCGDRLPRLRAGNVHDFNIYADDTQAIVANRMRADRLAAMSAANQNTLNNTYDFNNFLNGSISTESGAMLVEKSVYIDCLTPLRNNQTDPSNPIYTGKILGLDDIYHMDNADGSTTIIRGNSTDPGNPLGPFQAPIIPFSWNTNLPNGQLPYTYTPDDPSQLKSILATGAGAGTLTWDKTNWLMTTYAPTAPFIVAQPQDLSVATGQTATFSVVAGGSANLSYQWYFNTNTPVPDATNSILTLTNVQAASAGVYSVVVTNTAGFTTSTNVALTVSGGAIEPQISNATFDHGNFSLTINGNSSRNYTIQTSTNLIDWETILVTNPATLPFVWSDPDAGNFSRRFYRVQTGP
ncbi:MAG: immunoglobulin domain-containing protein [Limisphaerales bacterium]